MKLTFRFAVAILIMGSIASCKKDHGGTHNYTNSVIGTWELSQLQGSMPVKDFPAGNGNILILTATTYEFRENGQLKKNGTYILKEDPTVEQNVCLVFPQGSFSKRIIYDGNDTAQKVFIDVTNDQLTLVSGCFALDGGSKNVYKRLSTEYNNGCAPIAPHQ